MQKLMLALSLLCSASAFAGTQVVSCTNADGSDKLAIFDNANGSTVAVVTTEAEGGAVPNFKYRVKRVDSAAIGAPVVYTGKKIHVEIYGSQPPVKGRMRAHLTVTTPSIDEDVYCKL